MNQRTGAIAYTIFTLLGVTGFLSIIFVPQLEPFIQPLILKYADNPIGWLLFFCIRTISVVFFQIKLGIIAVLYHRALGFGKAYILSTLIFLVGGSINFFIGRRYKNSIEIILNTLPLGFDAAKKIKQFKKFLKKSRVRVILLFLSFSYIPLSYLMGMQKMRYSEFLIYLSIGGFFATTLMLSKDCLIGVNNQLSFFLQIFPLINCVVFAAYFTIKDELETINIILK